MRLGSKQSLVLVAGAVMFAPLGCKTTEENVKEEWSEVEEERSEAKREAEKLAEKDKEKYQDATEKRLNRFEERTAGLRADVIAASGDTKKALQDRVWELERQIFEAREELRNLEKRDARSWDADKQSMDEKIAAIDSLVKDTQSIAH